MFKLQNELTNAKLGGISDIDESLNLMIKIINDVTDKFLPIKKIKRSKYNSWINNSVKNAIAKRNLLRKKWIEEPSEGTHCRYKIQRNKVTKLIKSRKKEFYQNMIDSECVK